MSNKREREAALRAAQYDNIAQTPEQVRDWIKKRHHQGSASPGHGLTLEGPSRRIFIPARVLSQCKLTYGDKDHLFKWSEE